ncbi:hypothetical protein CHH28_15005 [Bacterioplanes sanyensis]|uniref:DUF6160 domain-containing protein n=1 Tax=Bacterioplanes sanyensis TaxID=1249553 RepID=A0A222FLL3_9GAMM|nr:DUF6160 family protein [Bacterioplanes sanyensis]ASP39898.1 hypothetical protein CHH28_15005 [Bacterioplanes sanyensis]
MKLLKKASLAAAIAAAPFAAQALQPLDDATLSNATGQSGVTIEIDIDSSGISIGEIEYTDQGSVVLQNIQVRNVDGLTQTIDVDTYGNLLIGMSSVDDMQVSIGGLQGAEFTSALALKSTAGEMTEVINNIDMQLDIGESKTAIMNLAASGNTVDFSSVGGFGNNSSVGISDLPASAQSGAVAILSKASIKIDNMNIGAFGYTRAQAEANQVVIEDGISNNNARSVDVANEIFDSYNQEMGLNPGDAGYMSSVAAGATLTQDQKDVLVSVVANGAAVHVQGLQFYKDNNGTKEAATIEQTIWAKGGSAALGGGVYIQVGKIEGTLDIAGIHMGGESIGGLKVSDINLSGMTQRIYGHN